MVKSRSLAEKQRVRAQGDYSVAVHRSGKLKHPHISFTSRYNDGQCSTLNVLTPTSTQLAAGVDRANAHL